MPGRHSLFWKLAIILVGFCLVMIALTLSFGQLIGERTSYLSDAARTTLRGYAREAEQAWREGGRAGVDAFQADLERREGSWVLVLDPHLFPLGSRPVSEEQRRRLGFMRQLEWPMGRQTPEPRTLSIPFQGQDGQLVMLLPQRYSPWGPRPLLFFIAQKVVPGLLALLLCMLLYRLFIAPLARLREQANSLKADDLGARLGEPFVSRRDELGELGRAFDHMADRLQGTVVYQRRLLSDLSHELRTPLSRLRAASEREDDLPALRQRLEREIGVMQQLVENTLELAWMDSERPHFPQEAVPLRPLWDVLTEDACFETGWPREQLRFELDERCVVKAHLNSLAQALENMLRNAIRHSPAGGLVTLSGHQEGEHWLLCLRDQGPGVAEEHLELIFEPFSRLDEARPGDGGFGLGLSIARSAIELQGGRLWARNLNPGLGLHMRLQAWPGGASGSG
ncbi:sensor histidine kinase [Pseudomonas tohonis]|uniref:sensor histidine kinase n=1 Tax=Pseudomonas tohonis TaxID=2725477 RepID=UPI0021D9D634|nr:sensor histidine kinase [Pseudomonas tohonis]UXY51640.1 sensor histidine kinase [Pseudomonas tohonis]